MESFFNKRHQIVVLDKPRFVSMIWPVLRLFPKETGTIDHWLWLVVIRFRIRIIMSVRTAGGDRDIRGGKRVFSDKGRCGDGIEAACVHEQQFQGLFRQRPGIGEVHLANLCRFGFRPLFKAHLVDQAQIENLDIVGELTGLICTLC